MTSNSFKNIYIYIYLGQSPKRTNRNGEVNFPTLQFHWGMPSWFNLLGADWISTFGWLEASSAL